MKYYNLFKTALSGISAAFCILNISTASAGDPTAGQLFEQMNNRYANLTALSYTVNRTTVSGTKSIEEKWDFRLKAPNLMKVEYYTPNHRLLVVNESAMWEYIPAMKKALRTDLASLPLEKKARTVASVMAHVAVDGLRLGDYSKMLKRVTSVTRGKDNIYIIEGKNPKFVIHADGEKACLVHSELYDEKGDLTLQTEASQFIQAGPEFWFPQNIATIYRSKKGNAKCQIVMTNIRVNDSPANELFLFTPPEGVQVATNDKGK